MIDKRSKIFLAGHSGMVGSSVLKLLKKKRYKNILIIKKEKLNLLDQNKVQLFLKKIKPKLVIIAAARAGGILANSKNKAKFIYENLQIQNNLIHSSYLAGVKNLIFLGSSCIYPGNIKKKINEEDLLSGNLERTNDSYAIAKIAGLMMCRDYSKNFKLNYKALMPTNLYGPGDNYDLNNSHFYPALLKKIYLAKIKKKKVITLWGSGSPKRELMYVDDLADAIIYFMNKNFKEAYLNIGTGIDHNIKWYAKFISKKLNYRVKFKFDHKMPNGTKRKILNISKATRLGWKYKTSLDKGFELTLKDFLLKKKNFR